MSVSTVHRNDAERKGLTLADVEIVHRHGAGRVAGEDLARFLSASAGDVVRDRDEVHNDLHGIAETLRLVAHGIVESGDQPGPRVISSLYTLANHLERVANDVVMALPHDQKCGAVYDVRVTAGEVA